VRARVQSVQPALAQQGAERSAAPAPPESAYCELGIRTSSERLGVLLRRPASSPAAGELQRQLSGGECSLKKHDGFGASYLWPPTGSYATHKSGCQVGKSRNNIAQGLTAEGVRLADWGYPNQLSVTNPET
jgi:hypothetical protein